MPEETPEVKVTGDPDVPIVAISELFVDQRPPAVASLSVILLLGQNEFAPDIAAGVEPVDTNTLTLFVLLQPVPVFVTVTVAAYTPSGAAPGTVSTTGDAGKEVLLTSAKPAECAAALYIIEYWSGLPTVPE